MSPLKFVLILVVGFILAFTSYMLQKWKESLRDDTEEN